MCLCFPAAVGYCHTWVNLLYISMPVTPRYACLPNVCPFHNHMPASQRCACITRLCPSQAGIFCLTKVYPRQASIFCLTGFACPIRVCLPDQVKPASPRYTHHKQVFSASEVKLAPSRYACLTKICMPHQDVQLSSTSSLSLQLVKPARAIKILPPGIIVG